MEKKASSKKSRKNPKKTVENVANTGNIPYEAR